ncbi:hypothetical protein CAI21_17305 [Alkalilimnicola ehrlichii]|uniref:Uncharacterized protein n=1 Tax=Alkalilimnicola ehrlichii TaxID=351052 RepID=A0A3E0WJR8_9GAMM|nr:hypothetical protein [Alkalilimnicola ehrlichii]RFA26237.1 hypothetical protein CAI21_17305 [Alkalilimnicola ehrlichii]RFA33222.1 hypothetical protein CAL65_17790 [Alkalilimnicola ehrlichii]
MVGNEEKYRRMALRRAEGYREPSPPKRPVAAAESYLVAHACFTCRKSFKVHPREEGKAKCPSCAGELHVMGRSFKAPPMKDKEQWMKVQALFAHGLRFFSYRSYPGAPKLPARFKEVERFVAEHPNHPFRVAEPNIRLQPTG